MRFVAERAEFAAQRRAVLARGDEDLAPVVTEALASWGAPSWWAPITEAAGRLFDLTAEAEGVRDPASVAGARDEFTEILSERLAETTEPGEDRGAQNSRITAWVSTAAVNAATMAAAGADEDEVNLEWVTMHDPAVRATHGDVDGQSVPAGSTFTVAGYELHYPGEPVGPPAVWINCRCVVRPGPGGNMTASLNSGIIIIPDALPEPSGQDVSQEQFIADLTAALEAPIEDDLDPDAPEIGDDDLDLDVPFYGVALPEGLPTGDRRKFALGSVRYRNLPLPFRNQPADIGGHDGAFTVGRIDNIWRDEATNLIKYEGVFARTQAAEDYIALIVDGMRRGVSVDVDDATAEVQNEDGSLFSEEDWAEGDPQPFTVVTDGRIAAITGVDIPAFQEAFVAIGTWADHDAKARDIEDAMAEEDGYSATALTFKISESAWDGSASRFTPEEWRRSCILDTGEGDEDSKSRYKLPVREPNGDLSRAGVHAAASRFNQVDASSSAKAKAKSALRSAYKTLGEEPPEGLTAACETCEVAALLSYMTPAHLSEFEEKFGHDTDDLAAVDFETQDGTKYRLDEVGLHVFAPGTKDGPGWITHPRATARIRRYWVRGAGAAKIRWGVPGDFNRCRKQLAKYVKNPDWLAGLCANMHKEAIGLWPGGETGKKHAVEGEAADAFTLVASGAYKRPPREWFEDPKFDAPHAITIDEDGRFYGHLAQWSTCHIGIDKVCTSAPSSLARYAYFRTGAVLCEDGTQVPVGNITMATGHAGMSLRAKPAMAHYDNTGTVVADVAAGEDEHGIWVAGAVRSTLSEEEVHALRAATLSGDWRQIGNGLELVAALAVNVPGFPIPRTAIAASGGEQITLVASGIMSPSEVIYTADPEVVAAAVAAAIQKRDRVTAAMRSLREARRAALTDVLSQ